MEIKPLAAKITCNGVGNRSTVSRARSVYICATADVLITNDTTGFTFYMHADQAIVMHKEPDDDGNYNWSYFVPISKHETDQYIVDIASDDPFLMPPANPMLYTLEKHVKSVSVEQALSKNKDYHSGQS